MPITSLAPRRRLAGAALGLAGAAAAATVALAQGASAVDPPPPVTVICETANVFTNYNSATHKPLEPVIAVKTQGQTVGFKKGAHPVYDGVWAQVQEWNTGLWGVIEYACLDHG